MIKRSISIANPAHLKYAHRQLVICQRETETMIPLEDLATVVLEHPQITLTHSVLSCCAEAWVIIVGCDGNYRPISLSYPIYQHTQSSLHIFAQIAAGLPARKKIWQSLVRKKIFGQAEVLKILGKNDTPLRDFIGTVRSGDPDNIEAQAARYYWTTLFGDDFRRNRDGGRPNPWLNYGYAILRACVARAVVGGWLNPALGVHHCNQFNPFNLVDDLIEPFRALIDIECFRLFSEYSECEMTPAQKLPLLGILSKELMWNDQKLPIFTALSYFVASFRGALAGEQLQIPEYEII